jgi:uncharacterized protein YjbI with pentapeptide repeats
MDERLKDIKHLWNTNQGLYVVSGILIGLLIEPFLRSVSTDLGEFLQSLVPEAISIGVTAIIIDRINQWRRKQQYKKRLLQQLKSDINIIALSATEGLWANDWWADGSLTNLRLARSDLRGANLARANLTGTSFVHPRWGKAKFDTNTRLPDDTFWISEDRTDITQFTNPNHPNYWRGFNLRNGNIAGKNYSKANLRGGDLGGCNLKSTNLQYANLNSATLGGANLQGTNLCEADLQNAIFEHHTLGKTHFDSNTILPDGNRWTQETDMRRFTDPTYPVPWRSKDPNSPAYQDKKEEWIGWY